MPLVSLIEKKSVSGVNSVTFSSIPATYRDLRVIIYYATNTVGNFNGTVRCQFNGSTSNIYNNELWNAENANLLTQASIIGSNNFMLGSGGPSASNNSSNRNPIDFYISEYRNTTLRRNGLSNNWGGGVLDSGSASSGNPYNYAYTGALEQESQTALSSITLFLSGTDNFIGTTMHLYGIG
jgi:hypothetical protein